MKPEERKKVKTAGKGAPAKSPSEDPTYPEGASGKAREDAQLLRVVLAASDLEAEVPDIDGVD
ncbi:MAG: hypothetical protein KJ907_10920 [Actinobacteria bacterium]|nr:hypothetical protein [Actinomycetota bacterium]MBU4403228.1 hypothetical protein [Actinomycetota bacterium]